MLTESEVIRRATKVIGETVINDVIVSRLVNAIRKEFHVPNDWRVFEHRAGKWIVRNEKTREIYKTGARGGSQRSVVFRSIENAQAKAYTLNKELTK